MNPYAIIGALVLWGASLGGTAWWFYGSGQDSEKAKQADIDKAVQIAREAAQQGAAEAIAKIDVKQQTIVQKVTRETIEKPVFRDCRSGSDAVGLLNAAAGHEQDQSADLSELPASAASR